MLTHVPYCQLDRVRHWAAWLAVGEQNPRLCACLGQCRPACSNGHEGDELLLESQHRVEGVRGILIK